MLCTWMLFCSAVALSLPALPLAQLEEQFEDLRQVFTVLARQVMQIQSHAEQSKKSEGISGVKSTRNAYTGNSPYHTGSFVDDSAAGMYSCPNTVDELGLGEFTALMNGVEFRTRRNSYHLVMKSAVDHYASDTVPIPMPDVPPEVSSLKLTKQITVSGRRNRFVGNISVLIYGYFISGYSCTGIMENTNSLEW